MALTPCSDLSPADWITFSELPWQRLVDFGPAGFAAYGRLRFLPDPVYEGQSENDVDPVQQDDPDQQDDRDRLRRAFGLLAAHTRTPEECYFCLWDGYGGIYGGDAVSVVLADVHGRPRSGPTVAPAFSREVLEGPRVAVPGRSYFLFRGPLSEAFDWGAAPMWPGQPRRDMPNPALTWPADHAWCVASDVDPHWAGIGADTPALDQLIADPHLDVIAADPTQPQPAYH